MNYYKKLVGDRIYLSPKSLSEDYIKKYAEWMNDFEVTDYIGRSAFLTTELSEKDWLENSCKNSKDRLFDIIELNDDKLIGTISLENISWLDRSAILGVFIGDKDNFLYFLFL